MRNILPFAAALLLGTASIALAQNTDIVALIDESGSAGSFQSLLPQAFRAIDAEFRDNGENTRYGLVGFGSASNVAARVIPVGGGLFGSIDQLISALGSLRADGGTEDGYAAISTALTNHAPQFRSNATDREFILFTDEGRDRITSDTRQTIQSSLTANRVSLSAIVNQRILADDGSQLIAVFRDDDTGQLVGVAQSGGTFTLKPFGGFGSGDGSTTSDYAELALANDGLVADITQLDSFVRVLSGLIGDMRALTPAATRAAQEAANEEAGQPQLRASVQTLIRMVSSRARQRLQGALLPGQSAALAAGTGLSAGETAAGGLGIWVDGSGGSLKSTATGERYSGNVSSLQVGLDMTALPNLLVGASFGLDDSELTLQSRGGFRNSDAVGGSLYVGYAATEALLLQAAVSYADTELNLAETRGLIQVAGADIDGDRWSVAANGFYTQPFGFVTATGGLGLLYSNEDFSSYLASDGTRVTLDDLYLGQANASIELAAGVDIVNAYVNYQLEYDFVTSEDDTAFGTTLTGGVDVAVSDSFSLGAYGLHTFFRDDERERRIGVRARATF